MDNKNFMRPKESKEFEAFRKEIIVKLGLTWEDWCWLWDKIGKKCQLFEPKSEWCPQHGYPLPCYKCGMPKPSGRLLTDEQMRIKLDKILGQKVRTYDAIKGEPEIISYIHGTSVYEDLLPQITKLINVQKEAQRDLSYPIGYRDGYADAMKEKGNE